MESQRKKAKRTGRATPYQVDALVEYMHCHPRFAAGKFSGKDGKQQLQTQWASLSEHLNAINGGVVKDSKQWTVVWRDLRYRAGEKHAALRRERMRTGNVPAEEPPLSALDLKIIGIIGEDYVSGTKAEDTIPEEEVAQVQLELGDYAVGHNPGDSGDHDYEMAYNMPLICMPESSPVTTTPSLTSVPAWAPIIEPPPSPQFDLEMMSSPIVTASMPASSPVTAQSSYIPTPRTLAPATTPESLAAKKPRHARRVRLGQQLQSSRAEFVALQKAAATNMEKLAEATDQLAAATMLQAEAAKLQAEAAKQQADNFEKIINKLIPLADKLISHMNK